MLTRRVTGAMLLSVGAVMLACGGCGGGGQGAGWSARWNGSTLQIGYGSGTDYPQYAALHADSSYLRLVPSTAAGWGTSVVLLPSFWSGGTYHQGGAVTVTPQLSGADLVLATSGAVGNLSLQGEVRLSPPEGDQIVAEVSMQATGTVALDGRPGEAFKPVMLSSMHISDDLWDAQSARVGAQSYPLPASGWVIQPPVSGSAFGLAGGTSDWKTNAPTITIGLDAAMPVTGWLAASSDPNDDNLGFWCATTEVPASWHYTITARQ